MARTDIEPRRHAPPIHLVNDFGNGLSPAECAQSMHRVFAAHRIPTGEHNRIIAVNDIRPFNVTDGAFQIYTLADNMQGEDAIFVGVVDPGVGTQRRGVVIRTEEGHSFVGPDNGLFGPAFAGKKIKDAHQIKKGLFDVVAPTFHGRDLFSPVAAELAIGTDPREIPGLEKIEPGSLVQKTFTEGEIVHLDGYPNIKLGQKGIPVDSEGRKANAVTIWTPKRFREKGLPRRRITIPVVETFEDVRIGEWLILEGSSGRNNNGGSGHAEIAIREGAGKNGSGNRLGVDVGDLISLKWRFEKPKRRPR